MKNSKQQREAIAMQLLPILNEMANSQKIQIIASTEPIQEITLSDLLALSDAELETLQKLVEKTKMVKKTEQRAVKYNDVMKPKVIISGVFEKPKYTIIS